ncbi:MAG: N-acetylmuramoyl-L-alanine amidase [Oscillospiraceae bacterium]|jgi:N-acetylmuramoyl-L-alanine amidase|nr:N-acetylmuramoyl-L-alanine amidase [Oscillospiraceae bacterium]
MRIFLSPSTQEWNGYVNGGTEEEYMNLLADRIEPYLRASGISYTRNDPARNVRGAIDDSNASYYDAHIALHSNAAGEANSGKVRGLDVYYAPNDTKGKQIAEIMANNFKKIYPLPDRVRAISSTNLGELTETKAPAVLLEIGYHDNVEDATWLKNNLNSIAKNIVESLDDYFGIPFVNPEAVRRGWVNTDGSGLNLRAKPSTDSAILTSIPDGAEVRVYGSVGDWYTVSYNWQNGYVYKSYIVLG